MRGVERPAASGDAAEGFKFGVGSLRAGSVHEAGRETDGALGKGFVELEFHLREAGEGGRCGVRTVDGGAQGSVPD